MIETRTSQSSVSLVVYSPLRRFRLSQDGVSNVEVTHFYCRLAVGCLVSQYTKMNLWRKNRYAV